MREYTPNVGKRYPLRFFASGDEYTLWNLLPSTRHLVVAEGGYIHLFGTDQLGRDVFSRILYGARVSLSIGVAGVVLTFVLGILFGGVAGYLGGITDRAVAMVSSPCSWRCPRCRFGWRSPRLCRCRGRRWRVYFGVTVILSLLGWPYLARQVRGRFLALRQEDFVIAGRLLGAGRMRVIFRHMLPNFMSHTITAATLAVPFMILGETALSFLGIGLRPPVVSWGVLMQQAQNWQVIVMTPWLLLRDCS